MAPSAIKNESKIFTWRHYLPAKFSPINMGNAPHISSISLLPSHGSTYVMAGFDLNPPIINWDEVEDFNGDISDLNYDFVWDYDNEDGEDGNGRSSGNDGGCNGSDDDGGGSGGGDDDSGGGGDQTTDGAVDAGINIKRRRHYPPDMKRAIYALCLERSDPGMMKEGVTKSVATDMGVPWRVV